MIFCEMGMIRKLIFLLCILGIGNHAFAMDVAGNYIIKNGDIIDGDSINITESTFVENYGFVDANVYVCPRCELRIKNAGEFTANIYLDDGAKVIQVVSSPDDANVVDVNTGYSIVIDNAKGVSFGVVAENVVNADRIIIRDSDLIMSDVVSVAGAPVEIVGQVNLYMDDVTNLTTGPILSNIVGNGNIHVMVRNPNDNYVYNSYVSGGRLFVSVERETGDDKVYNDSQVGDFIEDLRDENKNDNILDDLDSTADINRVMNKSARFNPNVLRRPLQIIHTLDMNDVVNYDSGVNVRPWGVFGNDFDSYGADINFAYSGNRVRISLGARVGKVEYVNTLDEFDAAMYGINMDAEYDVTDSVFANLDMGVMLTQFNIGDVLYDGHRYRNPDGVSGYGAMDVGYRLVNKSGIYVAPMFGVVGEYYKIEGFNTFDSAIRTGFRAGYLSEMFGIKYEYGFNVSAGTNEYLYAGLHAGVVSTMDMIGGDINVGIVRMFDTISYTISATAKLLF